MNFWVTDWVPDPVKYVANMQTFLSWCINYGKSIFFLCFFIFQLHVENCALIFLHSSFKTLTHATIFYIVAQQKMEKEIKERDDKYVELDTKFGRLHKRAKQRIQEVQKVNAL